MQQLGLSYGNLLFSDSVYYGTIYLICPIELWPCHYEVVSNVSIMEHQCHTSKWNVFIRQWGKRVITFGKTTEYGSYTVPNKR